MEITGKKVNFLGDSITEGVYAPDTCYIKVFERKFKPAVVRNYGVGGTRIAEQTVPTKNHPEQDRDFCSRVDEMDADADIVFVMGGTNDFAHGDAPMGKLSDRDPKTFYGACHTLMKKLIERYPAATIVFATPLHRINEIIPGRESFERYVTAIRGVAAYYSVPVLDLYANAGICPQIKAQFDLFMKDGVHPNDLGFERIADRLGAFLLNL